MQPLCNHFVRRHIYRYLSWPRGEAAWIPLRRKLNGRWRFAAPAAWQIPKANRQSIDRTAHRKPQSFFKFISEMDDDAALVCHIFDGMFPPKCLCLLARIKGVNVAVRRDCNVGLC